MADKAVAERGELVGPTSGQDGQKRSPGVRHLHAPPVSEIWNSAIGARHRHQRIDGLIDVADGPVRDTFMVSRHQVSPVGEDKMSHVVVNGGLTFVFNQAAAQYLIGIGGDNPCGGDRLRTVKIQNRTEIAREIGNVVLVPLSDRPMKRRTGIVTLVSRARRTL